MTDDRRAPPVAVVGCGVMGVGIAITAARGGRRTILYDRNPAQPDIARQDIGQYLEGSVRRSKMTREKADEVFDRVELAKSIDDLSTCEFVIEAIFEDLEAKSSLFRDLDAACAANTVRACGGQAFHHLHEYPALAPPFQRLYSVLCGP